MGHALQECEPWFESLVNTEGIQTSSDILIEYCTFESLVNTEGIQTQYRSTPTGGCPGLRVLLIRKEFKRSQETSFHDTAGMFESLVNTEGIQTTY